MEPEANMESKVEAYLSLLSLPMSTALADCQLPFHERSPLTNSDGLSPLRDYYQKELVYSHK